jgi:hypothetical protein
MCKLRHTTPTPVLSGATVFLLLATVQETMRVIAVWHDGNTAQKPGWRLFVQVRLYEK